MQWGQYDLPCGVAGHAARHWRPANVDHVFRNSVPSSAHLGWNGNRPASSALAWSLFLLSSPGWWPSPEILSRGRQGPPKRDGGRETGKNLLRRGPLLGLPPGRRTHTHTHVHAYTHTHTQTEGPAQLPVPPSSYGQDACRPEGAQAQGATDLVCLAGSRAPGSLRAGEG